MPEIMFGNPECKHCGQRHPSGWDCVAEAERSRLQTLEAIRTAKPLQPRRLLQTVEEIADMESPNMEAAAAYMAECQRPCAETTPAERKACLANRCACWTMTQELLRRASAAAE